MKASINNDKMRKITFQVILPSLYVANSIRTMGIIKSGDSCYNVQEWYTTFKCVDICLKICMQLQNEFPIDKYIIVGSIFNKLSSPLEIPIHLPIGHAQVENFCYRKQEKSGKIRFAVLI